MVAAPRTESITQATGISWDDWVWHLDAQDCRDATHKQIVARAEDHMPSRVKSPGWWAQTIALAYSQHIGRRAPGQRQDGTFAVSVSHTVSLSLDEALAAWVAFVDDRDSFAGAELHEDPTVSSTALWRRWRARLEDGTRVGIDIGSRQGRTILTATHARLPHAAERERCRVWWRALVDDFSASLTSR